VSREGGIRTMGERRGVSGGSAVKKVRGWGVSLKKQSEGYYNMSINIGRIKGRDERHHRIADKS